jgi:hypothetical protein
VQPQQVFLHLFQPRPQVFAWVGGAVLVKAHPFHQFDQGESIGYQGARVVEGLDFGYPYPMLKQQPGVGGIQLWRNCVRKRPLRVGLLVEVIMLVVPYQQHNRGDGRIQIQPKNLFVGGATHARAAQPAVALAKGLAQALIQPLFGKRRNHFMPSSREKILCTCNFVLFSLQSSYIWEKSDFGR